MSSSFFKNSKACCSNMILFIKKAFESWSTGPGLPYVNIKQGFQTYEQSIEKKPPSLASKAFIYLIQKSITFFSTTLFYFTMLLFQDCYVFFYEEFKQIIYIFLKCYVWNFYLYTCYWFKVTVYDYVWLWHHKGNQSAYNKPYLHLLKIFIHP